MESITYRNQAPYHHQTRVASVGHESGSNTKFWLFNINILANVLVRATEPNKCRNFVVRIIAKYELF